MSKRDPDGAADGFRGKLLQGGRVVFAEVAGAIEAAPAASGQPPPVGVFPEPARPPAAPRREVSASASSRLRREAQAPRGRPRRHG